MDNVFLLLLLIIPLAGALVCALLPTATAARSWALLISLATAAIGIVLAFIFPWHTGEELTWGLTSSNPFQLESIRFALKLGVDAVSLWLVLLTVMLTPLAIAASFASIRT